MLTILLAGDPLRKWDSREGLLAQIDRHYGWGREAKVKAFSEGTETAVDIVVVNCGAWEHQVKKQFIQLREAHREATFLLLSDRRTATETAKVAMQFGMLYLCYDVCSGHLNQMLDIIKSIRQS